MAQFDMTLSAGPNGAEAQTQAVVTINRQVSARFITWQAGCWINMSAKQARDLADQLEHAAAKLEQMEADAANTDQEKAL